MGDSLLNPSRDVDCATAQRPGSRRTRRAVAKPLIACPGRRLEKKIRPRTASEGWRRYRRTSTIRSGRAASNVELRLRTRARFAALSAMTTRDETVVGAHPSESAISPPRRRRRSIVPSSSPLSTIAVLSSTSRSAACSAFQTMTSTTPRSPNQE